MKPFTSFTGLVAPLDRNNVDTDAIIPKQFLKSIKSSGFGNNLFDQWRYLENSAGEDDQINRRENPKFVLNHEQFRAANILLTRENFGCGSSREHAVWALRDYGFRVLIAPSFADIFFNNCFKNGLLPVVLPTNDVNQLFLSCSGEQSCKLYVDLERQQIIGAEEQLYHFHIDSGLKHRLINGLDDIDLTLQCKSEIREFEKKLKTESPWLFDDLA